MKWLIILGICAVVAGRTILEDKLYQFDYNKRTQAQALIDSIPPEGCYDYYYSIIAQVLAKFKYIFIHHFISVTVISFKKYIPIINGVVWLRKLLIWKNSTEANKSTPSWHFWASTRT